MLLRDKKGMMTHITKRVDMENDLTLFTASGKVPAEEIAAAICDFYEGPVTSNVLFDFTGSDLSEIRAADVELIANLSAKYMNKRPSGKTAIVGSDDLTFGLLRMYEIRKDFTELPFDTRSFRNVDDAFKWLMESQDDDEAK